MSTRRLTRVNELLKREIAEVLYRTMNEEGFDLAAVTVTRVETSSDLRHARVMVSIRDHLGERDEMLSLLRKHRREIQRSIHKHVTLKYTPQLSFELDESIEQGDRILSLLSKLEETEPYNPEDEELTNEDP